MTVSLLSFEVVGIPCHGVHLVLQNTGLPHEQPLWIELNK